MLEGCLFCELGEGAFKGSWMDGECSNTTTSLKAAWSIGLRLDASSEKCLTPSINPQPTDHIAQLAIADEEQAGQIKRPTKNQG